jgi:hypothetical protein
VTRLANICQFKLAVTAEKVPSFCIHERVLWQQRQEGVANDDVWRCARDQRGEQI